MNINSINGLVNGTEQIVFDYEVTGSSVSSISTGDILNGDKDGWYTIIVRLISGATDSYCLLRLNNDSGSNYGLRGIRGTNTTVANTSGTAQSFIYLTNQPTASGSSGFSMSKIYAKSGSVRLIDTIASDNISGTTVTDLVTMGNVWNNTSSIITSMTFIPNTTNGFAVGTRIIILKNNNFSDGTKTGIITTPYIKGTWVRVGSTILTSAASSVTFSGLDGDRDVVYYLSSMNKSVTGVNGDIGIRLNNDSGNNYGGQFLYGSNTSVGASRATPSYIRFTYNNGTGTYSIGSSILFVKSGQIRPSLGIASHTISGTTVTTIINEAGVYNNTNNNITQLTIFPSTNSFDVGSQFSLYALRPNG